MKTKNRIIVILILCINWNIFEAMGGDLMTGSTTFISKSTTPLPKLPSLPIPTPTITSYREGTYTDSGGEKFITHSWFSDRGIEVTTYIAQDGKVKFYDQFFAQKGPTVSQSKAEVVRYRPDFSVYGRSITEQTSASGFIVYLYDGTGKPIPIESWETLK